MMAERMQQLDADMGRMQQELAANEDEQKHLLDVITASKTSTEQLAASSTHYWPNYRPLSAVKMNSGPNVLPLLKSRQWQARGWIL